MGIKGWFRVMFGLIQIQLNRVCLGVFFTKKKCTSYWWTDEISTIRGRQRSILIWRELDRKVRTDWEISFHWQGTAKGETVEFFHDPFNFSFLKHFLLDSSIHRISKIIGQFSALFKKGLRFSSKSVYIYNTNWKSGKSINRSIGGRFWTIIHSEKCQIRPIFFSARRKKILVRFLGSRKCSIFFLKL